MDSRNRSFPKSEICSSPESDHSQTIPTFNCRKRKQKCVDPVSLQVVPTSFDLRKARRIATRVRTTKACSYCRHESPTYYELKKFAYIHLAVLLAQNAAFPVHARGVQKSGKQKHVHPN